MKRAYETCDLMHGNICVSEPCICKGMHMASSRKNNHGGPRKGAGAKKKKKSEKKEPTKTIRVPISKIPGIMEVINMGQATVKMKSNPIKLKP